MDMIRAIKRFLARRALERSLRPDPAFRDNMLAQFTRERRERYEANVRAALHPDSD
jgi:hypothetical protein